MKYALARREKLCNRKNVDSIVAWEEEYFSSTLVFPGFPGKPTLDIV